MWKNKTKPKSKLDRREAFQTTASALEATFVKGKRASGDEVHLEHGPWKVILDTYVVNTGQVTVTYTRARALYVAHDDFTLRITRKTVFTRVANAFGFYGLLIGDRAFEQKYKVTCSNDPRGRSLMADGRLRQLVMLAPSLQLGIRRQSWSKRRKAGDGVRAVGVQATGVVKDPDRLVNHVRLVTTTLDQLQRIGSASVESVVEGRVYTFPRQM